MYSASARHCPPLPKRRTRCRPWDAGGHIQRGLCPAVGGATVSGDTATRATLWSQGTITDLGSLPGGPNSFAGAINERSQVVGSADSSSSTHDANAFWCNSSVNCSEDLSSGGVGVERRNLRTADDLTPVVDRGRQAAIAPQSTEIAHDPSCERNEWLGAALQEATNEVHAFLLTPINNGIRGRAGGPPCPRASASSCSKDRDSGR